MFTYLRKLQLLLIYSSIMFRLQQ